VAAIRRGEPLRLDVESQTVELAPGEVQVMAAGRPGYAVAEELGYLVALDTDLTPELVDEGLAREVVHRIQTMRKNAGFDIADYITSAYAASGRLAGALERHRDYVAAETLSRDLRAVPAAQDVKGFTETFTVEGEELAVGIERVT
jgi:isoleucyl-tRNA synthetase